MSEHIFENKEENIFDYLDEESKEYLIPELNQIVNEYTGGVCSSLTNDGENCLQTKNYKFTTPNDTEENIDCSNYCLEQIMKWLPKLFVKQNEMMIEYDEQKILKNIKSQRLEVNFYI